MPDHLRLVETNAEPTRQDTARTVQDRYYQGKTRTIEAAIILCKDACGEFFIRMDLDRNSRDSGTFCVFPDSSVSWIDDHGLLHYFGPHKAAHSHYIPA
jgi:hypothetical protein